MRHAFARTFQPRDFAPPPRELAAGLLPPLTPAAYLALCRKAAGVTVDQAARRLAARPETLDIARDLVRRLEMPGITALRCDTLEHLRTAFAFDLDVYRQLKEEPPHRHPRICRTCGATAGGEVEPGGDAVRMVSDHACARHADPADATGQAR